MRKKDTSQDGFGLVDLLITSLLLIVVAGITLPMMRAGIRDAKADAAKNEVIAFLRLARSYAIDQRRIYRVTFTMPDQMLLERRELNNSWTTILQQGLPGEAQFHLEGGVPTAPNLTPDAMGASTAIDLAGSNVIFFDPQGFATDVNGQMVNGIIYVGMPGHLENCRAITLFGATGRTRAWTLREKNEVWAWD